MRGHSGWWFSTTGGSGRDTRKHGTSYKENATQSPVLGVFKGCCILVTMNAAQDVRVFGGLDFSFVIQTFLPHGCRIRILRTTTRLTVGAARTNL